MTAYDRVKRSRAKDRPTALDYVAALIEGFIELHGDRRYADDPAVVSGIGRLDGMPVTVIAIEKGRTTADKVARNFGSAHPEGYRKAIRQMRQAEKFGRPVLCIVDTAGAFCGIGAEERGQGQAIAESMTTLMTLRVPVLSLVIGEGGSGGALALSVADQVWMLEDAYYSVITPEGAASILWKDAKRAPEAAEALRLTAEDLLGFGVIERILPEDEPLKDRAAGLIAALRDAFAEAAARGTAQLLEERYLKYRKIGGIAP